MKSEFGKIVRAARERNGFNRRFLARKLGITIPYLAHLEIGTPMHISDELIDKFKKHLHIRNTRLKRLASIQNEKRRIYVKLWRKKQRQASKK